MFHKLLVLSAVLLLLVPAQAGASREASPTVQTPEPCPPGAAPHYDMWQDLVTGDEHYNHELGGGDYWLGGVNQRRAGISGKLTELCIGDRVTTPIQPSQPDLSLCPADHPEPYFLKRGVVVVVPQGTYNLQAVLGPDADSPSVLLCGKADPPPAVPVDTNAQYTG